MINFTNQGVDFIALEYHSPDLNKKMQKIINLDTREEYPNIPVKWDKQALEAFIWGTLNGYEKGYIKGHREAYDKVKKWEAAKCKTPVCMLRMEEENKS